MNDNKVYEEKILKAPNGLGILIINIVLMIASVLAIIVGAALIDSASPQREAILTKAGTLETVVTSGSPGLVYLGIAIIVIGAIYLAIICWLIFLGIKILQPNEALVLTLFGKYHGTLKGEGIFFVNPFCTAINPAGTALSTVTTDENGSKNVVVKRGKKISLKSMTLNNENQKINDLLGNPIIIGINVIWKVENTAKAVFNVDNYAEFLSIQCDTALRNIVRLYPYDLAEEGDEKSLRGSSVEIAQNLKNEIQERVSEAGLSIVEARITHLAYAPEIAAAMLQRQQASAIIDARKMIVDGAVGMVEMALNKLSQNDIVELDDERRAQMASNLMVVLCSNKDAQPIVNSGSIY